MLVDKHLQTARDFLEAADREFACGRQAASLGELCGEQRVPRRDGRGPASGLAVQQSQRHAATRSADWPGNTDSLYRPGS